MRLRLLLLVFAALLAAPACGGGSSNYKLPTDSPLKPFKAPAAEDMEATDPTAPADDTENFEVLEPPPGEDTPPCNSGDQ